jgi:predicted nucleic acid-binding protein
VIVVDSNVIAYTWIRSDRTELAQRLRLRDPEWHVPYLWRSELRSALAVYLWRGEIDADRAAATMATAEGLLSGCEHHVSSARVLELAASSRLSAYDCEFVALAESLAVPLVTEDRAVLKAFPDVAHTMEGFLAGFPGTPSSAHEARRRYKSSAGKRRQRIGA